MKSKCLASLVAAIDLEQYWQGLIQTLKQFDDNQDNEETEDITLFNGSYVDPKFILHGGPMGQSRQKISRIFYITIYFYICLIVFI